MARYVRIEDRHSIIYKVIDIHVHTAGAGGAGAGDAKEGDEIAV